MEFFKDLSPIAQAGLAGIFTWAVTAVGAACVFAARTASQKILDAMLGFAAGVMIAASFWSLLAPAIEMSQEQGGLSWFPAACGFLLGAAFLRLIDKILPHLHLGFSMGEEEGVKTSWKRTTLLFLAITLHNIPEGLAIGVAFGAVAAGFSSATLIGAVALTIGIGIQNFPEGFAVSMPLRREGMSRLKSFWYGQLSAVVEPLAAVTGAAAVLAAKPLLPYALAFAAGAMIFVVVEQVIPESQHKGNTDIATAGTIMGFLVMMILDVALG
ncbi:MAG TPA: ZIP family metal transporter [Candidatus Omnitrophota bacterium]|nr:ZIP family metal transporter [Candidatus Omnitrophota bacterium]HPD84381.1 ZIP family metal transporter [Candidatus Omnitrophota bacterium]HRZ03239.1 ZIP family metal transporter [Candidatus Omnitrophota bacterium]